MRLVVDKMPGNAAKCRFRYLDNHGYPTCSISPVLGSCSFQNGKCACLITFAELLDKEQKKEKAVEAGKECRFI